MTKKTSTSRLLGAVMLLGALVTPGCAHGSARVDVAQLLTFANAIRCVGCPCKANADAGAPAPVEPAPVVGALPPAP